MKFIKYLIVFFVAFNFFSCGDDDKTTETNTVINEENSSIETIQTEVVITVVNSKKKLKANYLVMLFDEEFKPESSTPNDAIKTVKSNSKGEAIFNLQELVKGEETYYVEAFTKKSNGTYVLESKYRTKIEISKGKKVTTSIIVY